MWNRLNRVYKKKRSPTKDTPRISCFHCQTALMLPPRPLYSCPVWCCICSCKNSLGFLFEFYDLNRTLRNIFPPLPRSRRRNRVSSWFYALFLWFYVCGGAAALPFQNLHDSGGRNMHRINSITFPLLNPLNLFLDFYLAADLDLISSNFYRS